MDVNERRNYLVIKANDIIRKARSDLSLQELKILSYCFSMIKPNDDLNTIYTFSILDFCKVCGINYNSGENYNAIKQCFTSIAKQVFWIMEPDGSEVTVHWIEKARINRGSGKIAVRFDEDLQKYIFGLFKNFTQYELLCVLPMRSHYSFRIYELLKSYAFQKYHYFTLDELKKLLVVENYDRFPDFRRKVIEPAIKEINTYTDLKVSWEPKKESKKIIGITFYMIQLDFIQYGKNRQNATKELDHQMTIFDFLPEKDKEKGTT